MTSTAYFWRLSGKLRQAHVSERAELRKHRDTASAADKELKRCRLESEMLLGQVADWRHEAELLCKERDDALTESQKQRSRADKATEERNAFKASAESKKSEKRQRSKELAPASPQGFQELYTEIEAAIKQIATVPLSSRASELRNLKRSYHPDAQRLKSLAGQQLFTQLSQYLNGFCEPHLRQDCSVCHATRADI